MESLKGKLTEEEARELINNYIFFTHEDHEEEMLKLWKQKGYINELEETFKSIEYLKQLKETE